MFLFVLIFVFVDVSGPEINGYTRPVNIYPSTTQIVSKTINIDQSLIITKPCNIMQNGIL